MVELETQFQVVKVLRRLSGFKGLECDMSYLKRISKAMANEKRISEVAQHGWKHRGAADG
jgi:hypothetical protein